MSQPVFHSFPYPGHVWSPKPGRPFLLKAVAREPVEVLGCDGHEVVYTDGEAEIHLRLKTFLAAFEFRWRRAPEILWDDVTVPYGYGVNVESFERWARENMP